MNLHDISYLVIRYEEVMLLIIAVISFVLLARFGWKPYIIPLYFTISVVFELSAIIFGKLYEYNLFLAPLFGMFDYFFWSRFFTLKNSKQRKQLIWTDVIIVMSSAIELYRMYLGNTFMTIPSGSISYLFILIVLIYNYLTAYKIVSKINWFIFSLVFVYASFKCFFDLFRQFVTYWDNDFIFLIWIPHTIVIHLFHISLLYYLWKIGKNPKHFLFG